LQRNYIQIVGSEKIIHLKKGMEKVGSFLKKCKKITIFAFLKVFDLIFPEGLSKVIDIAHLYQEFEQCGAKRDYG